MSTIKERLLKLDSTELKERQLAFRDFMFYHGECEDVEAAATNSDLLGQNWITLDDLDYVPAQIIDNKIKPIINKQARFMFGRRPDVILKPYDMNDNEAAHKLTQYVNWILDDNKFWSQTLKAFRLATITKRVLLRLEANPNEPIRLYWHSINDFYYEVDPNDPSNLLKVILVKQDPNTVGMITSEQMWYRYTYTLEGGKCMLNTEIFKGNNVAVPIDSESTYTGLSTIPCWVICNEQSIGESKGVSDIKDLKPLQDQYNRKLSDFSDALRFNMFGQDVIIDATADSVESVKVAPNNLLPLVSLDDKTADYKKVENTFSNASPVQIFLTLLDDSMHEKLAIPKPEQIRSVLSAKAYKYLFTELIARCDEKWIDWEPVFIQLIRLIIESCSQFNCYDDWVNDWISIDFNVILKRNYPIPEDIEDKKRLAMEEVTSNVRSHRSYIKEFSTDEDHEDQFNKICEDLSKITAAENEQFN
ncbi:phage portal protein [Clostridium botulinum]|nr:phage portal protein [Clostridium botulinum]